MNLAQEPTPYQELNEVLLKLVTGQQAILGSNLVGVYLQGSFAVGGFDQHSDVDFIVAINEAISDSQLAALQKLHQRIYHLASRWAQHLEGTYFPVDILRDYRLVGDRLWYLDNGSQSLELSDHCNTVVVRWTAREQGVRLAGPNPLRIINPIPVSILRHDIFTTIKDWGQEILAEPERYNNRFYQTYIVLNFSRMLHDLINGRPGSKVDGAKWAQANLDSSWVDLIDRTWVGRPNPAVSVRTPADPADFQRTLAYVEYIIGESKMVYGQQKAGKA